jgi:acetamidase/formamidase
MPEQQPFEMSLDDIARRMALATLGSQGHTAMMAELSRRQTISQLEATEAQKKNAAYMLWSVIAAAVSAIITAAGVTFNVFSHYPG